MSSKPKKSNPSKKSSNDREPGVSKAPISVIFFVVTVLLAYWAMMELNTRAGGFNRYVYGPYESYKVVAAVQPGSGDDPIKRGADIYRNICSPCHQASGMGAPGQFPPLAGSDWVNVEGPNRMLRIVLNGLNGPIDVNGETWNAVMPGFGDVIASDEDLAAVISYVRNSWTNEASICTPEEAAAARADSGDRGRAWTATELLALPLEVQ
ncbi:MAG: cytochrome c [Verrucomicrobiota bacterium]|nr:cytochrome c [Verrucomicrobiota bacterium]